MCLKHLVIFLISISVAFAVTCHQSCTPGTSDCSTYSQQCRDVYCTYMRSVYLYQGNYTDTKLACSNEALLQPDINSPAFTTLNTCTRIVYNGVEYTMKICDNADYCSDDCVPVQKQQPGYVTCKQNCTPAEYNCPSNNQFQCSDYYCTYMKTVYQNNYTVTKQTCSNIARLQPGQNNPAFTAINQCTRNVYNGVEYTMKICDNANYCSDDCVPVQKQQPGYVTCKQSCTPEEYNCPANNQLQCSDYYCTYMKMVYQNNYTITKQTCSNIARLQPGQNNPTFTAVNQCIRNTYFGIEYTMKICNTDYCTDTCDLNQNPSPSPSSAPYGMISISLLVILMIFNLLTF